MCFKSGEPATQLTSENMCYKFPDSTRQPGSYIYARECYDTENKKKDRNKIKTFFPFSAGSGEYAWTNEQL